MKKRLLSFALTFVLLVSMLPFAAFPAAAETYGDLTYTVSNEKATITDCSTSASGHMEIPSTLGGYPVTAIGDEAFRSCTGLTSVTIPNSVTSIGDSAFSGSSGLTSITIPDSVTSIGSYAFYNTKFYDTAENWENNVLYIGKYLIASKRDLSGHYSIKNGTRVIADFAFDCCTGLTSVTIGDGVTFIGIGAFGGCTGLTSVTISDSVTLIGEWAFIYCTGLTSISIPDSVTHIGSSAFYGCTGLTSVTIPNSVTSIGNYAFSDCDKIEKIYYAGTSEDKSKINFGTGNYDLTSAKWYYSSYTDLRWIYSVTDNTAKINGFCGTISGDLYLPSALGGYPVTAIGESAFSNCTGLTSITIPNSVTSIGDSAFYGSSGLTSITIPDSVTTIGSGVFSGCSGLTSMTLPFIGNTIDGTTNTHFGYIFGASTSSSNADYVPASLKNVTITQATTIGSYAFKNCTGLTFVTIPDSVTSIGDDAFLNTKFYNTAENWENNVLYIGKYLIESKIDLSGHYSIKNGTRVIAGSAFYGCTGLTSVTIPNSVTSIGNYAFSDCDKIEKIYYAGTSEDKSKINFGTGNYDLTSAKWYYSSYTDLRWIYSVTDNTAKINGFFGTISGDLYLPSALGGYPVTAIGESAFSNCTGLTSITIPDSVTYIGSSALYGCTGLSSVIIPDSVTHIGSSAFKGCTGLTSMTLPFIGNTIDGTTNTHFGYIFGAYTYSSNADYVPASLKNVTITQATTIGSYAFKNCTGLTSVTIPDSVTSIGSSAFYGCTGLSSVIIPDSVTYIGSSAFYGCTGLSSVIIPDSVTHIGSSAFKGCTGLTSMTLPFIGNTIDGTTNTHFGYIFGAPTYSSNADYVPASLKNVTITQATTIGSYAFKNCTGLTSVSIPDSVISIGYSAFRDCTGLTSITIPESVISIGNYAFYGCIGLTSVTIPDSVTSIGDYAFYGCTGLTSVTIGDNVTSIGALAFYNCSGLKKVYISDVATWCQIDFYDYESNPLYYANALYINGTLATSLTISDGVTSIGSNAFAYYSGLTSITIPDSVTSIGEDAFEACTGLEKVYISDVAAWCQIDFYNYDSNPLYYADALYINGTLATSLTIPDGVTSIEDCTFCGYAGLTSVTIPDSVTSIEDDVFYRCTGLTSVTIPNSVTSIGIYAFYGCSGLTSITIPDSVTFIGYGAFYGCNLKKLSLLLPANFGLNEAFSCSKLKEITVTKASSMEIGVFSGCKNLEKLSIPFIGNTPTSNTYIGHLFGATDYTDNQDYVPASLKHVTVTNAPFIDSNAFYECTELESISIEGKPTRIASWAFGYCKTLKSISIPKSVTGIDSMAFYDCFQLADIWYGGTKAKKAGISISYGNDLLKNATWHYMFNDVASNWSYEGIFYCYRNGLMEGTAEGVFSPNGTMTRAQVVTILYRMAGKPKANTGSYGFIDVPKKSYYTKAANWAANEGIVSGVGEGRFAPNQKITRAEIAKMLYSFAQYRGEDVSTTATLNKFADAGKVKSWAKKGLRWAVGNGIITGSKNKATNENILNPNGTATRAEGAAMFMRFMEKYHS